MIDAVVATWNDGGNPAGIGDMGAILTTVLQQAALADPERVGDKIKTPFEQVASAFRAVRGQTNGQSVVRGYLTRMQHLPFQNPIPTGYPELGDDWLDTNNVLERHNFGADLSGRTGTNFGTDLITLLNDNGISTSAGNSQAIVDFFADVLFAGALTAAEVQAAITFLDTDDDGMPSPYNNARIRDTVGLMLGFAQFIEQ